MSCRFVACALLPGSDLPCATLKVATRICQAKVQVEMAYLLKAQVVTAGCVQ